MGSNTLFWIPLRSSPKGRKIFNKARNALRHILVGQDPIRAYLANASLRDDKQLNQFELTTESALAATKATRTSD